MSIVSLVLGIGGKRIKLALFVGNTLRKFLLVKGKCCIRRICHLNFYIQGKIHSNVRVAGGMLRGSSSGSAGIVGQSMSTNDASIPKKLGSSSGGARSATNSWFRRRGMQRIIRRRRKATIILWKLKRKLIWREGIYLGDIDIPYIIFY